MRFSRTALIERIDEIEADRKVAHEGAFTPRLEAWDKAVENYRANRAPELVQQLRGLAEKARKGVIITDDDLEEALGTNYNHKGNYRGFVRPSDPAQRGTLGARPVTSPYAPDSRLAALRALLVRTADAFVSTTARKELGFQPQQFIKAAI